MHWRSKAPEKKASKRAFLKARPGTSGGRRTTSSPVAPASKVYTGVLYDRLGLDSPAAGKRRPEEPADLLGALGLLPRPTGSPTTCLLMGAVPKTRPARLLAGVLREAMEGAGHDKEGNLVPTCARGVLSAAGS